MKELMQELSYHSTNYEIEKATAKIKKNHNVDNEKTIENMVYYRDKVVDTLEKIYQKMIKENINIDLLMIEVISQEVDGINNIIKKINDNITLPF